MAITMFDQWPFSLACGHTVVLGRLDKAETWTCETCGKITDLRVEPYRKELEDDRDTADQIDKQADSAAKPSSAPIQPTHRDLSRCCRRDPTPKVSVTAPLPPFRRLGHLAGAYEGLRGSVDDHVCAAPVADLHERRVHFKNFTRDVFGDGPAIAAGLPHLETIELSNLQHL
jgi:hypothetical protein